MAIAERRRTEEDPQWRLLRVDDLEDRAPGGMRVARCVAVGRRLLASRTLAYSAISALRTADGPAQSVLNPPGSIDVTWMPNPATSCASAWERPSNAHFDAWYAPTFGNALIPPMLDTWMMWPGALRAQDRQRRLRHPECAEEVRLQLRPYLVLGQLLDHAEVTVTGVVDHDVERAEVVGGPLYGGEVGVAGR